MVCQTVSENQGALWVWQYILWDSGGGHSGFSASVGPPAAPKGGNGSLSQRWEKGACWTRRKWVPQIKSPVAGEGRPLRKISLQLCHMLLLLSTLLGNDPERGRQKTHFHELLWMRIPCLYIPVLVPFLVETVSAQTYFSRQTSKREPWKDSLCACNHSEPCQHVPNH